MLWEKFSYEVWGLGIWGGWGNGEGGRFEEGPICAGSLEGGGGGGGGGGKGGRVARGDWGDRDEGGEWGSGGGKKKKRKGKGKA